MTSTGSPAPYAVLLAGEAGRNDGRERWMRAQNGGTDSNAAVGAALSGRAAERRDHT